MAKDEAIGKKTGQLAPGYTRPRPAGWWWRGPLLRDAAISPPGFYLCDSATNSLSADNPRRPAVAACHSASLSSPSPIMLTGTVKFYNDSKGFGFIVADDNQEEIFVHQTGLVHEIQDGDRVEFELKEGKKGPNAVKVTRIQ